MRAANSIAAIDATGATDSMEAPHKSPLKREVRRMVRRAFAHEPMVLVQAELADGVNVHKLHEQC